MLLLLPGALTLYLAFNSGGYFPGATSLAALALALALLVRIVTAEDPFEGLSVPVAVGAGALMLFGVWTLLSASWSDSSARALLEFNRVVLYLLALLLFGSILSHPYRVRRVVWGLALAFTAICVAGLATRLLPDVFEVASVVQNQRLGHPIGYWNALGLVASLAIVLCAHLTSSEREPPLVRILAAAALPLVAVTLLFTFSRGPLAAVVIGLPLYFVLARPRGLPAGLLAAGPPTAVALVVAYQADLLSRGGRGLEELTSPEAVAQGHDVALVVGLCVLAAAGLRLLLLRLDTFMAGLELGSRMRRRLALGGAGLAAAAVALVLVGTDLGDRLGNQLDRIERSNLEQTGDFRDRLTNPGINRLDHWEIALDGFEAEPLRGQGAGTFALLWERDRPTDADSQEGHSLYLEGLSELGIVGVALLLTTLLGLLVGVALRVRGPDRPLYAAVLAVGALWLLHAGVDWDWEIPAVTLWLFALAGAACAAPADGSRVRRSWSPVAKVAAGIACVALAATPALVGLSQVRLSDAFDAYERGDCSEATGHALDSIDALENRPEPYVLIGYCDARLDQPGRAERMMRSAIDRDPKNWAYRYGLALVRASAGRDPRPAALVALRFNPNDPRAREAVARFRGDAPRSWQRVAREIGFALR